jgi:hypothetical protein
VGKGSSVTQALNKAVVRYVCMRLGEVRKSIL